MRIEREKEREREPPLLQSNNKGAVAVMAQLQNQLANVATLPARPLILIGRIYNTRSRTLVKNLELHSSTSYPIVSMLSYRK